jgi:hypothetical protein
MKHWRTYFEHNRDHRHAIPWSDTIHLPPGLSGPFIRSLQRFQVGESGEGRHLRASAKATGNVDYAAAIELFVREEQEHARLMGEIIKRLGAPLLTGHWSDHCFIRLRHLFGLNQQLMVLLMPEIIAKRYFLLLHDQAGDPAVRAVCAQILHDEEGHVAFHTEYLHQSLAGLDVLSRRLLRGVWRMLFRLSVLVVVLDHRSLLRACRVSAARFWWDCELLFDDVAARIFTCTPMRGDVTFAAGATRCAATAKPPACPALI